MTGFQISMASICMAAVMLSVAVAIRYDAPACWVTAVMFMFSTVMFLLPRRTR